MTIQFNAGGSNINEIKDSIRADMLAKKMFMYEKIVNIFGILFTIIMLIVLNYNIYKINSHLKNIDYNLYNQIEK